MTILRKYNLNITIKTCLLVISILVLFYVISNIYYLVKKNRKYEGLSNYSSPQTNNTVDLPINTNSSCNNVCGPLSKCSKTGEQCTSDIDCYGCQPKNNIQNNVQNNSNQEVIGNNDAGKLTGGVTPTYSILTTDIGTKSKLYNKGENIEPIQYFKGVDKWSDKFNIGMELYNKNYNPSVEMSPFLPNYPERPSLTGQFNDNGPLASNAFL